MRRHVTWFWVVILAVTTVSRCGYGAGWIEAGVRGGISATRTSEDFSQIELFAVHGLPWSWELGAGWQLGTRLNGAAGALFKGDNSGFIGSVGPSLLLTRENSRLALDIGSSVGGISRDRFGQQDFGIPLQFISHAGLKFQVSDRVGLGYRFQHMSNASIDSSNPGLDMHMLEVGFRF